MKLLVADDERWIRKGILKMIDLASFGFEEVLEAQSLEEYEKVFLEHCPEIVVSDVRFPTGTSCELCQKLYRINPKTKFIMLSGYNDFEFVKAALGYKAVDYLLKPVDRQELNDAIRRAVQESIAREQAEERQARPDDTTAKNGEQVIRTVMEQIQKNCARKFTLSDLAKEYHISEAYFSSLFAKTAGVSLMNYIMEVRVEKAIGLLLQTDQKINDIAVSVSYEDTRYFAKVFKKITGESPSEYRIRQRQDLENEE
ncbi:MAG: helix-turn-helix domain-containing protein [Eubacteriales bacterium]|nr:helix-turn-helix domain-containing protein [Eubacteriales bacterium]